MARLYNHFQLERQGLLNPQAAAAAAALSSAQAQARLHQQLDEYLQTLQPINPLARASVSPFAAVAAAAAASTSAREVTNFSPSHNAGVSLLPHLPFRTEQHLSVAPASLRTILQQQRLDSLRRSRQATSTRMSRRHGALYPYLQPSLPADQSQGLSSATLLTLFLLQQQQPTSEPASSVLSSRREESKSSDSIASFLLEEHRRRRRGESNDAR
jgi:hypothetical protein